MEVESCKTCKFWRHGYSDTGECRRYAPRPETGYSHFNANLMGHIAWASYQSAGVDPACVDDFETKPDNFCDRPMWPATLDEEWCGEYVAKSRRKLPTGLSALPLSEMTETHIGSQEISIKTANLLFRHGLVDIRKIRAMSDSELLALPNFGPGRLKELRAAGLR